MTDADAKRLERLRKLCEQYSEMDWLIGQLDAAIAERDRLKSSIRIHRDQRGDDRCWMDDETLYESLLDGYVPPARDTAVELERCKQFIECRQNPKTEYVSPQREIERLTAERDAALAEVARLNGALLAALVVPMIDGEDDPPMAPGAISFPPNVEAEEP